AGPRARPEEARGPAASHPAAHDGPRDVSTDHGLPHASGRRPPGGRARARHPQPRALPGARGHEDEEPVAPAPTRGYFSRGSSASRRPSPKRLKPSTVTKMARPGKSDSQRLAWMKATLALRSQPQLGVGGWVPSPRNDSVASTMIDVAMPSVVVTMIGARQLGKM